MLGTFSNAGLGMGVAFTLEDHFSQTADEINRKMAQLGSQADVFAQKVNASLDMVKTGFAMTVAGSAILAPFVMGATAASDLEENINKVEVAFGAYADRVNAFSETSIDNFGVDKIAALDMAGLFGDMATGMGFAQSNAADMSMRLIALAGDLASFKNISHDVAQTALKSIFTGETESLKNLGIVMTEANLSAYALSKGLSGNIKDMSEMEKVMLRYNFVLDRTTNSQGDFLRTSDGYANARRTMMGTFREISATLGEVLLPLFSSLFGWITKTLKAFNDFAKSPLGATILRIIAVIGTLLLVGGLLLILMGGMRFAAYSLVDAFGADTRAKLINILATQGLTQGLRAMARAAWASILPFLKFAIIAAVVIAVAKLLYDVFTKGSEQAVIMATMFMLLLGPLGWLAAFVMLVVRGFKEFNSMADEAPKTGLLGFFQRLAGVIYGVAEIWQSWNGSTFELTDVLAQKLERLGILEFVINLGTWIVRLKEFFSGVFAGISEGFQVVSNVIWSIWDTISQVFTPISGLFDSIGIGVDKNASALERWKTAGKILGYILVGIFTLIAIKAVIAGVSMFIGLLPVIVVIALIVAAIWAVIWVFNHWGEISDYVYDKVSRAWQQLKDLFWTFVEWLTGLPREAFQAGMNFVFRLLDGIKSVWGQLKSWLSNAASGLWETVKAPFNFIGEQVGGVASWVRGDDDNPVTNPIAGGPTPQPVPMSNGTGGHYTRSERSETTKAETMVKTLLENLNITVELDGEAVGRNTLKFMELNGARD